MYFVYPNVNNFFYSYDCYVMVNFTSYLNGLKATNEWQDSGTGILHQVTQHPIDQVYLYTRHPCPFPPTQNLEDKVLAAEQVGLYAPPKPPPLAQRGS